MNDKEALHGLNCPRCGGMVPIPEGQAIVICPFCDLRSVVRGENGVRRYQVPNRTDQQQAMDAYQKFLSNKVKLAWDTARNAQLQEVFLVHLPFWAAWGRGLGWVFGREQQGSGNDKRHVPREVKVVEEMDWNSAACDVGEFGVNRVSLTGRPLEVYNPDDLHRTGMVFEPVGSAEEAMQTAQSQFEKKIQRKANLDQVTQSFVRIIRSRQGIVYYPLWVIRYLYKGRAFQVVVDGFSGEIVYGKGPGNVVYRAAVLVGGMAAGAILSVDLTVLSLSFNDSGDNSFWLTVMLFVGGLALMFFSYRTYRYGEHYEYQRYKGSDSFSFHSFTRLDSLRQVGQMLGELEHFR
jgi:hypothetical protein